MSPPRRPSAVSRRAFLASACLGLSADLRPSIARAADDTPVTGTANPALAPFDDLLTKFVKDNAVPGAALAVTRKGKLVYARGFGYADRDKKKPVEPAALFRIASISKPITAVGLMQLVDAGKVGLDDPVMKYLKLKPFVEGDAKADERWAKVTVRHCLQHTGGWDRNTKGGFDPIGVPGRITQAMKLPGAPMPEDIVRYMMGLPLDFDPGARMAYCNLGYLIVGRVMEAVTGEKYEPWTKKHVLAPVGVTGMALGRGLPENRPANEVRYYDPSKRQEPSLYPPKVGQQVPVPDGASNVEGYEAHGGWIASAVDLVRLGSALDYDRRSLLLSGLAIQEMWKRPDGAPGLDAQMKLKPTYYGCGWNVRPVGDTGRANVWHMGQIAGTSTLLFRRWDGLNWAVLFNSDSNAEKKVLCPLIEPQMHTAADAVKKWPDTDLFEKFPAGK